MTTKSKIILAGIAIAIISIFLYFTQRIHYIEKGYINSLVKTTNAINRTYRELEKKIAIEKKKIDADSLGQFLKHVSRKFPSIAIIAVSDNKLTTRMASKNDQYIKTIELYDAILNDFTGKKLNISNENPYIIRYYDTEINGNPEQFKFYIFVSSMNDYRILAVFPHDPGRLAMTRIALEVTLIVLLIIITCTSLYIFLQSKQSPAKGDGPENFEHDSTNEKRIDGFSSVELDLNKRSVEKETYSATDNTIHGAADTLNSYIYSLFKTIKSDFSPDSQALYLSSDSGILSKTFELKDRSFIKIDSKTFDTIDINNQVGDELQQSTVMILDDGRKVLFPLVKNNNLLGAISIIRNRQFSGNEISEMKTKIAETTASVHDFIVVNDVIIDRETGLHSKTFFNVKFNENLKLIQDKSFSILFISLFHTMTALDEEEKDSIFKIISPAISEVIKADDVLSRYDDQLGIILTGSNNKAASNTAGKIHKTLSKFRIKTKSDSVMPLYPFIGLSSSDTCSNPEKMITVAMTNMEKAVGTNQGSIGA